MKKLLLTAALGLGLGGGAWKYQNPEGTLEDFRTQANATVDRLKVGVEAVRTSDPKIVQEQEEQQIALNSRQEAETKALIDRLAKLEEMVLTPNEDEPESGSIALTTATDELQVNTDSNSASTTAIIANAEAKVAAAEARIAAAETNIEQVLEQQAKMQASFDTLENTISTLQASAQNMEGTSTTELARVNAIDSRLELMMRRVEEQTFDSEIASVKEGLQVLGADVLDVQGTLKKQETNTASDITSVNERASALDNRLDTLASFARQDKTSSDSGAQPSNTLAGPALATLSAGIDERFSALEDRLQTVNADSRRLGSLNDQMLSLVEDIASLKIQYADTDRSLGEISGNIDGLKTASESMSIETVQAEIRDQLANVQSQLENDRASDNSSELEVLINTTRNRIRTLELRVQDLPASSEEADNALQSQSALKSQINALEKRLETINQTDPDLANTLSNVQQQVEQLAAQSFVIQADLKAQSEGRTVEYKIYFDSNSADITTGAATVLKSFIAQEKNRTLGVSIYGFTDRSGSAFYNQKLAEQRATTVRSFLIQNGMDYTKIKALTGLGEDAAAAVLPDNAEDSQQRVVVLYAEQP
ncbi:MAG: outer membrane protein OmpA-like peptidoglycan-associated protein [bacterium]|jgi:outer membrane protein OmpA-like peptidoglycan-associated protein